MAAASPPPNPSASASASAVPPASSSSSPPPLTSPPSLQPAAPPPPPIPPPTLTPPQEQPIPPPPSQPPSQPNDIAPGGPALLSPPPQSPPAVKPPMASPPPPVTSTPPQSPPPSSPTPPTASPPPTVSTPPQSSPPPANVPPPSTSPPPAQPSNPPPSSPPPSTDPPSSPPPPPLINPPRGSPPPEPPASSPPPLSPPEPPASSPPPLSPPEPPESSPPPPSSRPPTSSPPPPAVEPPQSSPPTPPRSPTPPNSPPSPPPNSSTPPINTPPSPLTPPSRPGTSPTPPTAQLSPPSPGSRPSPSLTPPTSDTSNSNASAGGQGLGTGGIVAIGLVVGFLLLGLIGIAVWCSRKHKKKVSGASAGYVLPTSQDSPPKSDSILLNLQVSGAAESGPPHESGSSPSEPGGLGNSRSWFTYGELAEATNGFSLQNLLGEGGFGSVYKGYLPDGREVAVKQLKLGGGQGDREFRAELEIISRVHHRHLVSLVGYCISEHRRLLVYDYVPNNTLHFHLHGEGRPVLDWAARVKIAVGAARGIAYLHEDCHPRIIHRDIKSSNILLDNNYEARVSDFGLAKLFLDTNTHVTTRVMGTFGYMAPEYASSGKLTEKSDVFSFGVVLLELITGRKPVDASQPLGDESLVEWSRPLLSHALETEEFEALVDPRLEKNYVPSQMFPMIEAAAACVRHSSTKRPRITQVVRAFDDMSTTDLTNGMKVGESEMFNSAQQSEEIRFFRRMAFGSQNYSTDFFSQATGDNEER